VSRRRHGGEGDNAGPDAAIRRGRSSSSFRVKKKWKRADALAHKGEGAKYERGSNSKGVKLHAAGAGKAETIKGKVVRSEDPWKKRGLPCEGLAWGGRESKKKRDISIGRQP